MMLQNIDLFNCRFLVNT